MADSRDLHTFRIVALTLLVLSMLVSMTGCGAEVSPTLVATAKPSESVATSATAPSQKKHSAPATSTPKRNTPKVFKIGDVISIGNSMLDVLGWEVVKGDQFLKPDPGKKFIAVDVIIVNRGKSSRTISSLLQTWVKDETGQKYTVDISASSAAKGGSIDGELSPGERVRGKIGFQVPNDAKHLQFVFDASVFGTGKVFVDLGSKPVSVNPPSKIAGESKQQVFHVGDTITIGDFVLKVNKVLYPKGDQFNKPSAGNKFLVVDLTIVNKGSSSAEISTLLQMWVKDATGRKYTEDLMATTAAKGTTPDGEISPGEKVRGQVGFQVPVKATGLEFVFDASVFGTGKVFVALP